jgi:hypothetical protein
MTMKVPKHSSHSCTTGRQVVKAARLAHLRPLRYDAKAMTRGIVGLLVLAALLSSGCSEDLLDGESDLVFLNDSSCTVTVFVDGREAFTVQSGAEQILDGVGTGPHVLEAIRGGTVVERRTIELSQGEDFYWTVERC